jgi:hypothetical protein
MKPITAHVNSIQWGDLDGFFVIAKVETGPKPVLNKEVQVNFTKEQIESLYRLLQSQKKGDEG